MACQTGFAGCLCAESGRCRRRLCSSGDWGVIWMLAAVRGPCLQGLGERLFVSLKHGPPMVRHQAVSGVIGRNLGNFRRNGFRIAREWRRVAGSFCA